MKALPEDEPIRDLEIQHAQEVIDRKRRAHTRSRPEFEREMAP